MNSRSLLPSAAGLRNKLIPAVLALLALTGVARAQIDIHNVYANPSNLCHPLYPTTVYAARHSTSTPNNPTPTPCTL